MKKRNIERFTRYLHSEYGKKSHLDEICDVENFGKDEQKYSSFEYTQIGKRILLPENVVNADFGLDHFSERIANVLQAGEKNHVFEELDKSASKGDIESISANRPTYNEFESWCNRVKRPDHLFLPLEDKYYSLVSDWIFEHGNIFTEIGPAVRFRDNLVRIHWIHSEERSDTGYLLNSDQIKLVQKWLDDSDDPEWMEFNKQYKEFSRNRPLMIYINENPKKEDHNEERKIELFCRTIVSEAMVNEGNAIKLRL